MRGKGYSAESTEAGNKHYFYKRIQDKLNSFLEKASCYSCKK